MRPAPPAAAVLALLLLAGPAAAGPDGAGPVRVRFVAPERYTDAENRIGSGLTLRATLFEIGRLMRVYGADSLKPGETLAIDVLDIDLAGIEQGAFNPPYGLRLVTETTPPRFRLRYVLSRGGRRVLAAEETVTNLDYLLRYARLGGATFAYERELLRDWFQARFALRRPPPG